MLTVSGKKFDVGKIFSRASQLFTLAMFFFTGQTIPTDHASNWPLFSQSDQINMRSLSVARADGPVQDWPDQRAQLFCHTHSLTFCNEQEWASDSHMQDVFTIATYHISHTSVCCTSVIFFCR